MQVSARTTQPLDLLAAVAWSLFALLAVDLGAPQWLRVPLGLGLVLFVPGYALAAALFPANTGKGDTPPQARGGLAPLARVALAIALSLAVVVLVGLALAFTTGVHAMPVSLALVAATTAAAALGAWRRARVPEERRFVLALHWRWDVADRPKEGALGVFLAVCVLLAVASGIVAFTTPHQAKPFTEFYVLGSDGRPDCYPATYSHGAYHNGTRESCTGEAGVVTLGVANHEGHTATYWVRLAWTNETALPGNTTQVDSAAGSLEWQLTLESVPVDRDPGHPHVAQSETVLHLPLPPGNGTWRLSFQLYRDVPPPVEPTREFLESPYRRLHLWIQASL